MAWKILCKPKAGGGLGFRHLKFFNAALLGKQAWRLLAYPNSLAAQILKARYYPDGDFLSSEIGANPSYTWRGIWSSKWVVKRGVRWTVGNWERINVWSSPWIPGRQTRMLLSPRGSSSENLKVCDLLEANGAGWNKEKVVEFFLLFERDRILSIPISSYLPANCIFWDLEKDGKYSARSAYRAISGDEVCEVAASSSTRKNKLWNKIWNASTIPRVKMFY